MGRVSGNVHRQPEPSVRQLLSHWLRWNASSSPNRPSANAVRSGRCTRSMPAPVPFDQARPVRHDCDVPTDHYPVAERQMRLPDKSTNLIPTSAGGRPVIIAPVCGCRSVHPSLALAAKVIASRHQSPFIEIDGCSEPARMDIVDGYIVPDRDAEDRAHDLRLLLLVEAAEQPYRVECAVAEVPHRRVILRSPLHQIGLRLGHSLEAGEELVGRQGRRAVQLVSAADWIPSLGAPAAAFMDRLHEQVSVWKIAAAAQFARMCRKQNRDRAHLAFRAEASERFLIAKRGGRISAPLQASRKCRAWFGRESVTARPRHSARSIKIKNIIPGRHQPGRADQPQLVAELAQARHARALPDHRTILGGEQERAKGHSERPDQDCQQKVEALADSGRPPEPEFIGIADRQRGRRKALRKQAEVGDQA